MNIVAAGPCLQYGSVQQADTQHKNCLVGFVALQLVAEMSTTLVPHSDTCQGCKEQMDGLWDVNVVYVS